jgi:hypothetical protein
MITIILEDRDSKELERICEDTNGEYLIQHDYTKYKYLSQLSEFDYDVFSSEMMPDLIEDLLRLKRELTKREHMEHVSKIIELARRCQNMKVATLTFTPWGDA